MGIFYSLQSLWVVFLLISISCSRSERKNPNQAGSLAALKQQEIELLKKTIEELKSTDEKTNVVKRISGFEASGISDLLSSSLVNSSEKLSSKDLKDALNSEEKIFTFENPEGLSSHFSSPILGSSASLNLLDSASLCDALDFSDDAPTFEELVEFSKNKNVCGEISVYFCLRFSKKSKIDNEIFTTYNLSPDVPFTIPCQNDTFESILLSLNDGSKTTDVKDVMVRVSVKNTVSQVYFTDDPNCKEGGDWKDIQEQPYPWTLSEDTLDLEGNYRVYAKFRDVFDQDSDCLSAGIKHIPASESVGISTENTTDDQNSDTENNTEDDESGDDGSIAVVSPPSGSSVLIDGGDSTKDSSVNLILAAVDASEMYVTNDASCLGGGTWEPYATTKSGWSLGQSNATATVFVKFKNEAGSETSCLSDSIVHDDQPPGSSSVTIDGGTRINISNPGLTLSAVGANDMYITNTAGCAADGTWEAYATSKLSWSLDQSNSSATVYTKFRDAAGNESACISDSVIHDDQGPITTSITIDGGAVTNDQSPDITLAATDAAEMYLTNNAACSDGGIWESFSPSKSSWNLGQSNSITTVYVKFRDVTGNESNCINDTILHDDLAPISTSITIDGGAVINDSSPDLTLAASDATEMYVTNTAGCSADGVWETYATSKTGWTLEQTNATATVYIKFRDETGNESSCINDTIIHDNQAPSSSSITIDGGAATNVSNPNLTLAATGASEMYITNTAGCAADGTWETYATSKSSWTLGQANATATVYVKFRDTALNESTCVDNSIVHDDQAPSSTSISIDGGSTTNDDTPDLSLAATGASEMYITNNAGCSSGGTWESYASSKSEWTLGQTNATATVYVKFRDEASNESSCINDTIDHDNQGPTSPTISVAGGASITTDTSPSLTLSTVGASQMYITNVAGCSSGSNWESYSTSKGSWGLTPQNTTTTVYVKYRDSIGNESTCVSDSIVHDNQAPSTISIKIASNEATNDDTPPLTLGATGASEMYITNTSGCGSGGTWEAFNISKASWPLAQLNATATVYAKFRDTAGNVSNCANDTTAHDNTPPTGTSITVGSGDYTSISNPTVYLSATDVNQMYITNTAGCSSGGNWVSYSATRAGWALSQANATATVYVAFRDSLENTSACISDTIVHDNQEPTSISITIDGGSETRESSPNLTLAATGASEMYITNNSGCSSGGNWESYATSKSSWTLGQTDATATVYVQFRDAAGNESSCINDSIIHDNQGPSAPTGFTPTAGYASNDLIWNASVGASGYIVIQRSGSAVSFTPQAGTTYNVGETFDSGDHKVVFSGNSLIFTDENLSSDTTYHYSIYSYDSLKNYSTGTATNQSPNAGFSHGFRYYRLNLSSVSGNLGYADIKKMQLRFLGNAQFHPGSLSSAVGVIGNRDVTVSARSTNGANYPYEVFDDNFGTKFQSEGSSFSTSSSYDVLASEWIALDFGAGSSVVIDGYSLDNNSTLPNSSPDSYVLEASDDGSIWSPISGSSHSTSGYSYQEVSWVPDNTLNDLGTFTTTTADAQINLSWTRDIGSEVGLIVVRRSGSAVTWTPSSSTSYSVGALDGSHDLVYSGSGMSFSDTGLSYGTTYHYTAFTFDKDLSYSSGTSVSDVPDGAATIAYDFEIGDTSNWTSTGDTVWGVTTTDPSGGTYAGVSGNIIDSQSSCIEYDIDLTGEPNTVFYFDWKVSSEFDYDFARFYVNGGSSKYHISGNVAWETKSYTLTGGITSTVKWCYEKDGSQSDHNDNMHLDTTFLSNGILPPMAFVASGVDTAVNMSWTDPNGTEDGFLIVRRTSSEVTWSPVGGNSYSVGVLDANHEVVYKGSATSYNDTSLTNDTTYHYATWGYTNSNEYSTVSRQDSGTPSDCSGISFDASCWFRGAESASCNTTCSAQGLTFDIDAYGRSLPSNGNNMATYCENLLVNLGFNLNSVNTASGSGGKNFCGLTNDTSNPGVSYISGSGFSGTKFEYYDYPICSCQ